MSYAYTLNSDAWGVVETAPDISMDNSLKESFAAKYPEWTFILGIFTTATRRPATWSNMTKSNLVKFVDYLQANYAPNTANQYAVRLKAVLNIYADEITLPKDYAKILSPRKIPSTAVYLNEDELKLIQDYTPKNDNERFVRNMFLISAYTGCRHIDAVNLNESNIRNKELVFVARKTHKEARLPLKPIVADYIASTPRVELSDVGYNKIIRRICRNAGITERVKILKAGKETEMDKCDAVSSHTARRSFATCLYLKGVDLYTISRLCQHSDVKLTTKYICAEIRSLDDAAMSYFS